MDDEILTVEEAAALLKSSPDVVLSLLMSSELAGRNIGGDWRTTRRALVSFVDGVPLQMACCTPDMCRTSNTGMAMSGGRAASGRCCS
ncbi:MAG: helix-turn-helix domain-containing protein [Candidatus Hydrogenedentes bacterium]|nr:helix-turn-helix domain-containing protein [Candidatus Hydrogenedentota bacterium]